MINFMQFIEILKATFSFRISSMSKLFKLPFNFNKKVMEQLLKKVIIFNVFFILSFQLFGQQVNNLPYTLEQVESEITKLENEKQRVILRYNQIKNQPDIPHTFISNIELKIQEIDNEILRMNNIKKSVIQSIGKQKGENNSTEEIQIITKKDFQNLPLNKQEIILSNPSKFKIID